MKRLVIIFVILIGFSFNLFSQIRLSLIDGRNLTLESYTFHSGENYMSYRYIKPNGKTKNFYTDFKDIYSININGKDSIMYRPLDIQNDYSVEEMGKVVLGRNYAINSYKTWWAFAAGVAIGGGSLFIPARVPVKLIVPVSYVAAMFFVRPTKSYVFSRYPDYANDQYFLYGFQSSGRRKIMKNTFLGVVAGFAASGIIWGTINAFN